MAKIQSLITLDMFENARCTSTNAKLIPTQLRKTNKWTEELLGFAS